MLIFVVVIPAYAGDDLEIWGTVNPDGNLAPGDEVCCIYTVQYDFDSDQEFLEFYTDLSDPRWQFTISIDGAEQEKPKELGRYEIISGFELYYSGSYTTLVKVKLNGTVPSVAATGNYSIFDVSHYDATGEEESSASVQRIFLNPSDLLAVQTSMEEKLSNLRLEIDTLSSQGVDTTLAEEKYEDAYDAISAAKDSTTSVQSNLLSSADLYIEEANSLLDNSWTKFSLEQAEKKIDSVDSMISYFEDSEGLSDDSRVWVIKSYNDNAKTLLVLAEDKFDNSYNTQARDYANQAESKAEEAYSYASSLNEELNLNAPVKTEIWSTVAATTAATSSSLTSESGLSSLNLSDSLIDTDGLDDIDSLLHSEVDIESFLQIAGKMYDLLVTGFDFLNEIITSASDN